MSRGGRGTARSMSARRASTALLRAAHPGPAAAVTVLGGLLAAALGGSPAQVATVVGAVLAGQLSIGWSNDLLDAGRDRRVGRTDKPIATGDVDERLVRGACAVALIAAVPLSFACGLLAGATHLLIVAAGWAYNLGAKATVLSWLPYAVAFGALPVFVSLAVDGAVPPGWMPLAGALLGVGAHLVNVLPDLDDDAATGVRGLPHRIGARWTAPVAVAALALASVVIVAGAPVDSLPVAAGALAIVAVLAVLALVGDGRAPFRAAVGIALVDVVMFGWAR